jgi:DNA-binding PadR family transcriptional regulator
MLDVALLGVLEDGPQHGYELRKLLKSRFGNLTNVSFGSIYPALSRLERGGAVETVEGAAPVALSPPTGSLTGERAAMRARRRTGTRGRRSRKVYRITPAGRQLFLAMLTDTSPDDARSFLLRLSLARYMDPATRLALLERRRGQLAQHRSELPADDEPGRDPYAQSVAEHIKDGVDRDIAWLDRLIEAERSLGGAAGSDRRPSRRSA